MSSSGARGGSSLPLPTTTTRKTSSTIQYEATDAYFFHGRTVLYTSPYPVDGSSNTRERAREMEQCDPLPQLLLQFRSRRWLRAVPGQS